MKFIQSVPTVVVLSLLTACGPSSAGKETVLKAEGGDASAQTIVGSWHYEGKERLGIYQDYAEGLEWFRKAAEQGEPYALRMIALSYERGDGVSRDYAQAATWFRKAAEQDDSYGQYWLGNAYAEGSGGIIYKGFNEPQDLVLAYAWLNVASNGYYDDAEKSRDKVEAKLSPAELAEAQRLSSNWQKGQSIQREK
jgi:hypothetical protein